MAIDAKMSFLRQIEKNCADKLTTKDMETLVTVISDVLEGYDMVETLRDGDIGQDDLLESYEASLTIQGRSPKTIARYKLEIRKFMEYCKVTTRRINVYHIRNWFAREKERGLQESTLEGNREVLSAYFGWLFREGLIDKNPMVNVGTFKVPKKQKDTFTEVDMQKMYDACDCLRDKLIIRFLATTGCRVSEVVSMDRDMLNLNDQECLVHGKGNKERMVYFDSVTAMMLEEYLESRKDDGKPLFIAKGGKRLQAGGIRVMLKKIEAISGVDHVHPHKFRRTLATELARKGMPIQQIASILGHEKIETTMKYIVQNRDDVRTSYRRYA